MTKSKIEGIEITDYWKKETPKGTVYSVKYSLPSGPGAKSLGTHNFYLKNDKLVLTLPDNCFTKEFLERKDEFVEHINEFMKFPLLMGVRDIEEDDD